MELDISEVSTLTRQALSHLLDAPDRLGKDWCLLAVKMGLTDKVRGYFYTFAPVHERRFLII